MRFRQHQQAAQDSTRRLLLWFALVLLALVLAVNAVLALVYRLSFPFTGGFPPLFFATNTAIVLLFVLGGCWFETLRLREGGTHVARLAGARPAQAGGHSPAERQERRFVNIVAEMALASRHAPAPAPWVLPRDDAINAFAAGWAADDAVIVVTRGALERLTREELQGVVAHEFSHLVHGDTRLNMRLIGLVWGLQMVFTFGRSLAEPDEHGRRPAGVLFGLGLMAVGALGWAGGRALQAAVSRQREFLADASAVKYTRLVAGIGGALRKTAHQAKHRADRLRSPQASALGHLYLSAPGRRWAGWWATHPTLGERLARLYGGPVELLPAEPLPAPTADERALGFAPGAAAGPAPPSTAPEAWRHDALQNPAWHDAQARERDALARIARWHGPGEQQAALLALLLAGDDAAGQARWAELTRGSPVAGAVHDALAALGPSARLHSFALLARRCAAAPAAQRRALRLASRPLVRDAAGRLRRFVLLCWLRPARPARGAGLALAALRAEAAAATACLAPALGVGTPAASRWAGAVWQALQVAPPAGARLAPALRLRHLSAMQRPQLARAWVDAVDAGLWRHAAVADTLTLACWLLDTPLPPALARQRPAPDAAQARSL